MIKFLLATAVGFIVLALIVTQFPISKPTDHVQADTDMPYGLSRYENQEVVCYIFDRSQKGGISCMSKLGSNLH